MHLKRSAAAVVSAPPWLANIPAHRRTSPTLPPSLPMPAGACGARRGAERGDEHTLPLLVLLPARALQPADVRRLPQVSRERGGGRAVGIPPLGCVWLAAVRGRMPCCRVAPAHRWCPPCVEEHARRAAASGSVLLPIELWPHFLSPHTTAPPPFSPTRQVCTGGCGGGVPVRHGVPVPLLLVRPGARLERAAVQGL